MKKLSLYLLLGIVLLILIIVFGSRLVDRFALEKPYKAQVVNIEYGNNIILSNDKVIRLAGVFISYKGTNYRQELIKNIKKLLIGRTITVKEILKYRGKEDGYPLYPLSEVCFEDGTMVNAKLLEEGMAFFDHGYYKGKEKFERLQEEAKIDKRGIWGSEKPPVVVYIGSRRGILLHYPECLVVKKIREKDKIYYYFHPPDVYFGKGFAYHCEYRKEIEKAKGIDESTHDYMQP